MPLRLAGVRCYTRAVTPLDLVLRSAAIVIALVLAAAAALAFAAAALDYLSGTTGATPPFLLARERRLLFLAIGLPALITLVVAGSVLAGIGVGSVAPGAGSETLLIVVDIAFGVAVAFGGVCSPLARNWVLASGALGAAIIAFFLLLAAVAAQPANGETGLLAGFGPRLLFGLTVGGIWLTTAVCASALLALFVYVVERVALLLHARRFPLVSHEPRP